MTLRLASLRAPILMVSILVFAGIGYAAYASSATLTVNASTASFSILYTAIADPPGPANIGISVSSLPSAHVVMSVATLLAGQTLLINYTVEDFGSLGATNVVETIQEKSTNCDGVLALAQIGVAPTSLSPLTPETASFTITDNAPLGGPVPPGCPDPFTAVWWFNVTGQPV